MPAKSTVKAQPYPYEIPSIEYLKERDPKLLNPWFVQEFFRIEALLRSPKVMKLYTKTYSISKKRKSTTDCLYENYLVNPGWSALTGFHHAYLPDPRNITRVGDPRIFELRSSGIRDLKSCHKNYSEEEEWQWLKESILSGNPKSLYLEIDVSCPTNKIISALRKLISEQKIQIKNSPDDSEWFETQYVTKEDQDKFISQIPKDIKGKFNIKLRPWKNPKTLIDFDVETWIDYFRCYDLRQCKDKTYGQIAGKVYGDSKTKYDAAGKAVKRVSILIWYAKTNNWPPPKNFQNETFPPSPPQ